MEVEAAGAQIRAGQALPAQHGAIGAAAHRDLFRFQPGHAGGLARGLYQMEMRLDLFQHVAVAVLDLHLNGAFAVLSVQKFGKVQHVVFFELQLGGAVVAQDIAQFCGGHIAVHLAQMIEALPALGRFGAGGDG